MFKYMFIWEDNSITLGNQLTNDDLEAVNEGVAIIIDLEFQMQLDENENLHEITIRKEE
jgi:hypothetical protein